MIRCLFFGRRLHLPSLAYCSTTFAAQLMSAVFSFYYVKIFLVHYKISDYWFNVAQIIFMIWNAINDPLFGYIQDNSTLSIFRVRRKSILYGAPIYVFAFATFWFPWATDGSWVVGVHLLVSLCLFDAMLTFVLLAQCALFAEMSTLHEDRLRLVFYSQVASLVASCSVGVTEFASSGLTNFVAFQITCVAIALVAWAGFTLTGLFAKTTVAQISAKSDSEKSAVSSPDDALSIWRQTWQILRQRNFLAFVGMNFLQILHTTFHSNFVSIFLDVLVPTDVIGTAARSTFKGALFITSQILVLCLGPWLRSCGAYWVIMRSFWLKIAFAAFFGFLSYSKLLSELEPSTRAGILMAYILFDSSAGNAMFATFNLLISDVIDDDMAKNRRASPLSSMVFGTNALITKPAISLAPMLVIHFLNPFGFESFKTNPAAFLADPNRLNSLRFATASLVWGWPLVMGLLQIIVFKPYQLRNTHDSFVAKHLEE